MTTAIDRLRALVDRHASSPGSMQVVLSLDDAREILDRHDRATAAVDEQQGRVAVLSGHLGQIATIARQGWHA